MQTLSLALAWFVRHLFCGHIYNSFEYLGCRDHEKISRRVIVTIFIQTLTSVQDTRHDLWLYWENDQRESTLFPQHCKWQCLVEESFVRMCNQNSLTLSALSCCHTAALRGQTTYDSETHTDDPPTAQQQRHHHSCFNVDMIICQSGRHCPTPKLHKVFSFTSKQAEFHNEERKTNL